MFRRSHRIFVGIIVMCLVESCKTVHESAQLAVDTTKLQNTVAKSFHFALTDTIDFWLLDVDSTRPSRRLVRHTQVEQRDTTEANGEVSRMKKHAARVVHDHAATSPSASHMNLWLLIKLCLIIIVLMLIIGKLKV